MSSKGKWLAIAVFATGAISGDLALRSKHVQAADHLDPPGRTDPGNMGMDRNADIADVYAWHRGMGATQSVVLALTFSGPNAPVAGQKMPCDRNVLYNIHIDNTGDGAEDRVFRVRFGLDSAMNCFARWEGLPGTTGPVVTRTEFNNDLGGGVKAYAGLRDDAFFFDLQGFRTTLMTGRLSFVNDRDFFAGKNTSAIVVEVPATAINNGQTTLRVWATTARAAM
jgi:hypothetical protein